MPEKRYYIVEVGEDYALPGAITESELRHRTDEIINLRVRNGGADWSWEKAFDIMLHGGKDESDELG